MVISVVGIDDKAGNKDLSLILLLPSFGTLDKSFTFSVPSSMKWIIPMMSA